MQIEAISSLLLILNRNTKYEYVESSPSIPPCLSRQLGKVPRSQQTLVEYLKTENEIHREKLGKKTNPLYQRSAATNRGSRSGRIDRFDNRLRAELGRPPASKKVSSV
jgi:hypothetical protein